MPWTKMFVFVFLYAIIDGFISNLLYPAKLPYLMKDILILLTFFIFCAKEHFGYWMGRLTQQLGSMVWIAAILFFVIGFAQMFNPISPGLLIGVLGLKVIYFYWILTLMAFVYFDSSQKIISFMRTIFLFSVPVNIFAIAQFIVGPALLFLIFGPTPHVRIDIAAVGNYSYEQSFLRVIGTFASSGQYGNFLVINTLFGFALMLTDSIRKSSKWFYVLLQMLNFTALLASGSRSSFIFLIASLLIFFVLCRQARAGGVSILISGLIFFGAFQLLGGKVVERYRSLSEINMVKDRTATATAHIFLELLEKYPLGKGLGSASTAATHLSSHQRSSYTLIENYPSKLQSEVGIAGVICYYFFTLVLLVRWFDVWLKSLSPPAFLLGTLLTAYCFTQLMIANVFFIVDAPPVPIFLWTFVGIIARITESGWRISAADSEASQAA